MEYLLEYTDGSKTQEKLSTDVYKNDFEKEEQNWRTNTI